MAKFNIEIGGDGTGFEVAAKKTEQTAAKLQASLEAKNRTRMALAKAFAGQSANAEIREIKRVHDVETATRANRAAALRRERAEQKANAQAALRDLAAISPSAAASIQAQRLTYGRTISAAKEAKGGLPPVIAPQARGPGMLAGMGAGLSASLGGQFAAVASVGGIVAASRSTIQFASSIKDLSEKAGVSAKTFQEVAYAARLSGADISDVSTSFRGLAKARSEALGGNQEALNAFSIAGISRANLEAQSLEQTYRQIADVFRNNDFGADTEPLIERMMGRGATNMLATFKAGLQEAAAEAHRMGIILEEGVVDKLDTIGDKITMLAGHFRGPLASALVYVANVANGVVKDIGIHVQRVTLLMQAWQGAKWLTKEGRDTSRAAFQALGQLPKTFSTVEALMGKDTFGITPPAAKEKRNGNFQDIKAEREATQKFLSGDDDNGFEIQQGSDRARIGLFSAAEMSATPIWREQIAAIEKVEHAVNEVESAVSRLQPRQFNAMEPEYYS
jgi:hypothetical protein